MPTLQTALAIDFGLKRVGLAIGNSLTRTAEPLAILHHSMRRNDSGLDKNPNPSLPTQTVYHEAIEQTLKYIREWQVNFIVLGIPYHPDGSEHEMTQHCWAFKAQLERTTPIPIYTVDERYSSVALGKQTIKHRTNGSKAPIAQDDRAAALLLEQYFSEHP